MVSVPTVTGGPPGTLINRPGNLVGYGSRAGPEYSSQVAAMLNVTSALEKASGRGRFDGDELAPINDPRPAVRQVLQFVY